MRELDVLARFEELKRKGDLSAAERLLREWSDATGKFEERISGMIPALSYTPPVWPECRMICRARHSALTPTLSPRRGGRRG